MDGHQAVKQEAEIHGKRSPSQAANAHQNNFSLANFKQQQMKQGEITCNSEMKIHDRFEAANKTSQLQPQMGGSRGSMAPNSNKLNSIYSLQQAAGYNSLSIN
jgi:hypothetical protein